MPNNEEKTLAISFSPELVERIAAFKEDWYKHYKKISKQKTPTFDGSGKQIVKKRPDGKDYIDDAWMSDRLNKYFPGWSLEPAAPLHFLGSEQVVAQVILSIIDERLLAFGINPPIRKFYGVDAVRIQYRTCECRGKIPNCKICGGTGKMPHTPENVIDVGDNCQSAVTGAKKRAINRLTGIGDDIYGKRIEENGAGSMEDIITGATVASTDSQAKMFNEFLAKHKIPVSKALSALKLGSLSKITDYKNALDTITKELGL